MITFILLYIDLKTQWMLLGYPKQMDFEQAINLTYKVRI